jgi:hypothetical protein
MIAAIAAGLDSLFAIRWLRKAGIALGAVLALWLAWWQVTAWHARQIEGVADAARTEQAMLDTAAFAEVAEQARQLQDQLIAAQTAKATAITAKVDHDHSNAVADIDRAVAAKLREQAARQARARGTGNDTATAIPGAAGGDHEAYCAASGWLPFGRALSMAADAEKDAAQARACAAWVTEQAAAWPKDATPPE